MCVIAYVIADISRERAFPPIQSMRRPGTGTCQPVRWNKPGECLALRSPWQPYVDTVLLMHSFELASTLSYSRQRARSWPSIVHSHLPCQISRSVRIRMCAAAAGASRLQRGSPALLRGPSHELATGTHAPNGACGYRPPVRRRGFARDDMSSRASARDAITRSRAPGPVMRTALPRPVAG
ncbi:hypothetical protein OH77DRAFT_810349 [Trametes cingulata]|nr:hypothetical protein OH77DRAFT_810349 [Trametes cingulata]